MNFRDQVIQIVQQIPEGKVTTYGTVATMAGQPRGARLVAGIMNAFGEDDLPWQRVINRHGFISIKNPDHPKEEQKALLEDESIEVSEDFMVDLEKYGWWG
jgi:methylated-DNA-protein-cysteine methyltransferase related protein